MIDFISLFTLIISALFHFKAITLSDIMIDLLFIRWSVFFIIGISLYKIFVKETNLLTYINIIVALALIFHIFELKSLIICSSITLVIYLGTNGYLGFLKYHVLTFIGSISYSLYLIHQNIGYVIINKGYEYDIHPLVSILSSIVFSIIIAVILNKLVEKPASKFLKNIYQKRNANNVYKKQRINCLNERKIIKLSVSYKSKKQALKLATFHIQKRSTQFEKSLKLYQILVYLN